MDDKEKDVHTEHCCINCGCKYGDDILDYREGNEEPFIGCSVKSGRKKQSIPCNGECIGW